jgi:hypothetical protein
MQLLYSYLDTERWFIRCGAPTGSTQGKGTAIVGRATEWKFKFAKKFDGEHAPTLETDEDILVSLVAYETRLNILNGNRAYK